MSKKNKRKGGERKKGKEKRVNMKALYLTSWSLFSSQWFL
jgi:hypothetical protein